MQALTEKIVMVQALAEKNSNDIISFIYLLITKGVTKPSSNGIK